MRVSSVVLKSWYFTKGWLVSLILIPICWYILTSRGHYTWIDNADLVIHEAGHFVFMFFGRFIYTLGGTLMQIILPSIIAWFFVKNGYRTGVQVALLWLGQNLVNISVYAADASAKKLPLLGGNKVYHDWNYILGQLNILSYDAEVGNFFVFLALVVFLFAIFMPLIIRD